MHITLVVQRAAVRKAVAREKDEPTALDPILATPSIASPRKLPVHIIITGRNGRQGTIGINKQSQTMAES
jgi:hypothetical protein